jgi:uncharacterized protein
MRAFAWVAVALTMLASGLIHATELQSRPALDRASGEWKLGGPLGSHVDLVIANWLLRAPDANPAMLTMFADRDKPPHRNLLPWSGEFAGKYLTGATQVLRLTRNDRLKNRLDRFAQDFAAQQAEDGYLGPYPRDYRLTGKAPNVDGGATWDAWGHYHAMLGLLLWHEETGSEPALAAARKIGDLLCEKFLPADKSVVSTGSAEMNQAVAHSLVLLHRQTEEQKYLDLAEKIVAEFAAPGAGDYLRAGLAGTEFYQTPKPRWESLHPIMALAELYWVTGKQEYRTAFENLWWSIAELDRHNNGGFSSGEQAQGNPYHRGAIETCCTIAWMAMSVEMLRMTGDPIIADELELSTLNQVVGLHDPAGAWCTYNTPMDGRRVPSTEDIAFQIRPGSEQLNCCSVNAARGFGILSDWAVMKDAAGLTVNWYGLSTFRTDWAGTPITLRQDTNYPVSGRIVLHVDAGQAIKLPLRLRIPHWSQSTKVVVNEQPVATEPGKYLTIDRTWKSGDRVTIDLDMSLRYWRGEREYEGKSSIYRGPILLALETPHFSNYSSHWQTAGDMHVTKAKGATVEYVFEGDKIIWTGALFDDAGQAKVSIDGKEIATVDQYGPQRGSPFRWEKAGLGPGLRTIRIEALGTKQKQSKDVWINVSSLEPTAGLPRLDAQTLHGDAVKVISDDPIKVEVPDAKGKPVHLVEFGRAGIDRMAYVSWLDVEETAVTPFTRDNPSRTARVDWPGRWEKDILKFEEQDKQSMPPENPILFVGSSSIRIWNLKRSFPDLPVMNRGFGGSQVSDVLHYFDRVVLRYRPKTIVFYAGDNDLAAGDSPEQVAGDFAKFADRVRKELPETRVIYISIKPSIARWKLWDNVQTANRLIEEQAEASDRLEFLDISSTLLGDNGRPQAELLQDDGLHLNEKGYEHWSALIKPLLESPFSLSLDRKADSH